MAIRFKHRGEAFTVDTPEEAIRLRALLRRQDEQDVKDRAFERYMDKHINPPTILRQIQLAAEREAETPWNPAVFLKFIDRLGRPQLTALAALVEQRRITDEDLRKTLNVSNNQALAGVLSGISKQAAALDIPARAIFTFENLRNAGKRRSTYAVADKFLEIATEMSWPALHEE